MQNMEDFKHSLYSSTSMATWELRGIFLHGESERKEKNENESEGAY